MQRKAITGFCPALAQGLGRGTDPSIDVIPETIPDIGGQHSAPKKRSCYANVEVRVYACHVPAHAAGPVE